ncbi:MAG: phenylalanine--tRNA ligase subunit beta [Chlorobi bacterium]|nr:phenylalanine--tRNA ligase subunit beta [Chlorobiota bacterium]
MKISYNWLKEYVKCDLNYNEVSTILTDIGLEVEGIEEFQSVKGGLEGLIIGEVKTKAKHPDADKLSVTTVDIGEPELLNIVCGAPNVDAGQKVVVAPVGTTLYDGEETFKIKKAKIRGALSEGMICAEDEIGLGNLHDGIMVLSPDAEVGLEAKKYFNIEHDYIFEIGLTPNRIDGASHFGAARDLASFLNLQKPTKATLPTVEHFKIDNHDLPIQVEVEDSAACPRYSGITLTNIEVKESPDWLKTRLKSIGLNPINNVVDITNYVLHEIGQPLHAFDADKIAGNKVIIKTLKNGTKFTCLDEETRELSNNDLMICNAKEGMCIAGVFGGLTSGVTEKTKNIFLESANFNPVFIRKTSKKHLLFTDAAFRFERGADPNITVYALKRAAMLIKEIAGGQISSDIIDVYPETIHRTRVEVLFHHIERLSGVKIPFETIKKILESLDIEIIGEDNRGIIVLVPTYRVDVKREADVIEEILRIYGYNNIDFSSKINSTINHKQKPDIDKLQNIISDLLSANGFNEIMSNSLTKSKYYENLETYKEENLVKIFNPLSKDLNCMRQTLLYGGLESVAYNINRKNSDLKLYEFGNCYTYNEENKSSNLLNSFTEQKKLELFITGKKYENNWVKENKNSNFFELKAYVLNVLERLGINIENLDYKSCEPDIFEEGVAIHYSNMKLAGLGIVNRKLNQLLDIEQDVFYAEILWDNIVKQIKKYKVEFIPMAKYPSVKRDLALLLDKDVRFEDIKNIAFKAERKLLKKVNLFDVYEGDKIEKDKKSYAVSFILQDEHKTLKDKQIDKIMNNLIKRFENELKAQIR